MASVKKYIDEPSEAGSSSAADPPKPRASSFVRLSGSARKRFRRLIAANMDVEEAKALALKPWSEIPLMNLPPDPKKNKPKGQGQPTLEIFQERELTPESEESQELEELQEPEELQEHEDFQDSDSRDPEDTHEAKACFKEERESKVGIRNNTPLTNDQMKQIHRALIQAILETCRKGMGPRFDGFIHKLGWILIKCQNQESQAWLEREVPKVKLWPEAELSVIPESEFPKPAVAVAFVPRTDAKSVDEVIHLLKAQNSGLYTQLWKVLQSRIEENGLVITFSLDGLSVETLRSANYQAVLGFGKITFKIQGSNARHDARTSGRGSGGSRARPVESQSGGVAHQTMADSTRRGDRHPHGRTDGNRLTEPSRGRGVNMNQSRKQPRYWWGDL